MGQETKIEWCDHTFNPWHGCVKVSQGCKHCYADALDRRFGESHWGPSAPRRMLSEANWQLPRKWNREAEAAGVRRRVFCASMADVFEQLPPDHISAADVHTARWRLWGLIIATPWLDWLLLTKRPENVRGMVPPMWLLPDAWPANAWAGASVEDQATADARLPEILRLPAPIHFASYEPALSAVDFRAVKAGGYRWDTLKGERRGTITRDIVPAGWLDWIIVGGESGPSARPFDASWAYDVLLQRKAAGMGTAVFIKQMGSRPHHKETPWKLKDKKGGRMAEWPEDLRVREFPGVREEDSNA